MAINVHLLSTILIVALMILNPCYESKEFKTAKDHNNEIEEIQAIDTKDDLDGDSGNQLQLSGGGEWTVNIRDLNETQEQEDNAVDGDSTMVDGVDADSQIADGALAYPEPNRFVPQPESELVTTSYEGEISSKIIGGSITAKIDYALECPQTEDDSQELKLDIASDEASGSRTATADSRPKIQAGPTSEHMGCLGESSSTNGSQGRYIFRGESSSASTAPRENESEFLKRQCAESNRRAMMTFSALVAKLHLNDNTIKSEILVATLFLSFSVDITIRELTVRRPQIPNFVSVVSFLGSIAWGSFVVSLWLTTWTLLSGNQFIGRALSTIILLLLGGIVAFFRYHDRWY